MAQTKAKETNRKPTRRSGSGKAKAAKAKRAHSDGVAAGRNGHSKVDPAKAASRAKIPLLAGGAALAGTVGGVVLGATRSGGKILGVKLPRAKRVRIRSKDLANAAKEIGRFGESIGDLTNELRRAREGLADGNGKHSSPVEVLLRGLTQRR
jgi:hypothetical protein